MGLWQKPVDVLNGSGSTGGAIYVQPTARVFVAVRQMVTKFSLLKRLSALEKNFNELKQDLEEIFADYNDINEDTRAQIEARNTTLAELQTRPANRPRRPVGFITPKE